MLLTYVDESYSRDRYYISGVAVHHESVRSLENQVTDIVAETASVQPGVRPTSELHGHELFHGKGDWALLSPRQRLSVYNKVFQAIADHDVSIFLRGLDIPAQKARYVRCDPPHDIVLQHLLERINAYADETAQAALVIADELQEHDRHRRHLSDFKALGTPGYLSSRLPRIVDTIHFAPSHHSRLIQLADMVVFLHRRRQAHRELDARSAAANAALWQRIEPRIEHEHCWHP